ncbi:MAG: hypothetical protein JWQ38_2270 [Flavipsychrobacter sp.]|nr:hypothetical protein [Flavipsychrobacter sp.]
MRSIISSLLLCTCCILHISAQPLSAFVDIQNQLMVWDHGMIRKADFLPPNTIKIGRTAIPFLDNSRSFKIYYNGSVRNVNIGFTNAFYVTDNLVAFLNQKSLNVFDRGVTKNLTGVCDQYFVGDSVVLFFDSYKSEYRAYYNSQIYTVETYVPDSVLPHVKVSDNIIAYDNFANQFKIFFRGNTISQEDYHVTSFDVGRNTVAYVDIDRKFKIFHNGQTFVIDDFSPLSYKAGDNLVAFVSGNGYFKVFQGDSVHTIGFMNPTYQVGDNIIAYKDPGGMFKIYYKGEITQMENYYPSNFNIQYNSVAYMNTSGTLRLFSDGEAYDVTNAELTNWQLNYDVITYQIGQGIFKVFYNGTEY